MTQPPPPAPTRTPRRPVVLAARVLLLVFFVLLVVAVLSPSNGQQDALLQRITDRLARAGAPASLLAEQRVEILANVAIVVPVGLLGSLAFPSLRWQDWAAYAFVGALAVELAQGVLLPDREMSATDVVANTTGALLGALAVALFRRRPGPSRV